MNAHNPIVSVLRTQAADWYRQEAARQDSVGSGATAMMFRRFAERIANGEADHRLSGIIAGQADYDRAKIGGDA
jgi:hypothetical protein